MFITKNTGQQVLTELAEKLEELKHKKATVLPSQKLAADKLSSGIDCLAKAIDILDSYSLKTEAKSFEMFLEKFAGDRDYSDCLKKIAFSSKENAQSNALVNSVIDRQEANDGDSLLELELDDDLNMALDYSESDED